MDGSSRFSWHFFFSFPSRFPEAGRHSFSLGRHVACHVGDGLTAIPLGIAAAVYLEEYGSKNWLTDLIEINIANLAGVPSIVYGLMALGLFVYQFRWGSSILTAGLTLALLILPMVIIRHAKQSARCRPASREAAFALGATKWQTVQDHVLPYSMGGISTGLIIALSRAIGETALDDHRRALFHCVSSPSPA